MALIVTPDLLAAGPAGDVLVSDGTIWNTSPIPSTHLQPTVSSSVPANHSAIVAGGSFTLLTGITLTLASGAVFKIE